MASGPEGPARRVSFSELLGGLRFRSAYFHALKTKV